MPDPDPDYLRKLEEELAAARLQLGRLQRLELLGALLGTTTHEFNNILTTIINHAKLGLRNTAAEARSKAFEKILAAGQRATRITRGVLTLARNNSAELEPTDLAPVIEEVLALLEREMSLYRVRVSTQLAAVPPAMANGAQIQQVLMNLLVNARQAMPNGGQIYVRLWHEAEGDYVSFSVRDTGHGIPPETLPHIFDPYFSTKMRPDASGKGGTGLGLTTCRDIIESHRGRIRVESTPGAGTAFTIKIPAARAGVRPGDGTLVPPAPARPAPA